VRWRRVLLRSAVRLALLAALVLAIWTAIAGPVTVLRVIRYGDTQIDDFLHCPYREMAASPSPYLFTAALHEGPLTVPLPAGGEGDLDALLESSGTIALLVLKDDRLVLERYYQGHSADARSQSFSMSKSILSLLVGAALEDGLFQSLDQPVTDFIPELAGRGYERVTIAHLLSMTSGSAYVESDNPFGVHVILNYTPNVEERLLRVGMEVGPGTVWRYKSGDNALLGLALSRALAPRTLSEYMQERLWVPLGMEAPGLWSLDREGGLEKTWCCLAAVPRDFLRLGRLALREGEWQGEQILPAEWVRQSTQVGRAAEAGWDEAYSAIGVRDYGYQWWLLSAEEGSYLANGKDGQFLYINPARQAVILRLGWSMGEMPLSQWLALFDHLAAREW